MNPLPLEELGSSETCRGPVASLPERCSLTTLEAKTEHKNLLGKCSKMEPNCILLTQWVAFTHTHTRAANDVCFHELLPRSLCTLQGLVCGHRASVLFFSCRSFEISIWHATHVPDLLLQDQNDSGEFMATRFSAGSGGSSQSAHQDSVSLSSDKHRHVEPGGGRWWTR